MPRVRYPRLRAELNTLFKSSTGVPGRSGPGNAGGLGVSVRGMRRRPSGDALTVLTIGKRMKPRQWRRIIFRDTQAKSHYRTLQSGAMPFVLPTSPTLSRVWLFPAC